MASYPSEKQSVIVSSKRNTAYLMPLIQPQQTVIISDQTETPVSTEEVNIENPFPVSHISGNNKHVANNSDEIYSGQHLETSYFVGVCLNDFPIL